MAVIRSFGSDNHAGVHPSVLDAIAAANHGYAPAYGADPLTREMEACFRAHFGEHAQAFVTFNGTGANVLSLALLTKAYEAVICAASAHINTDECGAPERILGVKLLPMPTQNGKLTPDLIAQRLGGRGDEHHVQPRVVSVSQSTELGTCYSPEELTHLADFAHDAGLYLHLDGARLANAAVTFNCSLRALTTDIGADVVSFGGTKNGLLAADAVVVLRPELAEPFRYFRKQSTQLASKMRFLSAQLIALLRGDLWRENAAHANAMARRLADGLVADIRIRYPVQANAVFAVLSPSAIKALQERYLFYVWNQGENVVRWMTSFATTPQDVDAFLADIRALSGAA